LRGAEVLFSEEYVSPSCDFYGKKTRRVVVINEVRITTTLVTEIKSCLEIKDSIGVALAEGDIDARKSLLPSDGNGSGFLILGGSPDAHAEGVSLIRPKVM
jgi:hypothetical protein